MAAAWPREVAGVRSWKGIKFDEFSFEVKKCPDGQAAQRLVDEFVDSDGLTREFCESAVDVTFLAYKQRRPDDEIMMLQELATHLMQEFRRRTSVPEQFLADELLKMFTSSDPDAAESGETHVSDLKMTSAVDGHPALIRHRARLEARRRRSPALAVPRA